VVDPRSDPDLTAQLAQQLIQRVLDGRWPPGVRLPPERTLAEQLGASRTSVRDAVKRLAEWGVLRSRQGSGIVVLPRSSWKVGVLGPALTHGVACGELEGVMALTADALGVRRALVLDMVERAAALAPPDLDAARLAVDEAWAARGEGMRFVLHDVRVFPLVLAAAGLEASVWLLNSLTGPYVDAMAAMGLGAVVPQSYVGAQNRMFDAICQGRADDARALMASWLDELEAAIATAVGG